MTEGALLKQKRTVPPSFTSSITARNSQTLSVYLKKVTRALGFYGPRPA